MSGTSCGSSSRKPRSLTASQIAKDTSRYNIWSSYHHLTEGSYDDIPADLLTCVEPIFDVCGQLPEAWVTMSSNEYQELSRNYDAKFLGFLRRAKETSPMLFSTKAKHSDCLIILGELVVVFTAYLALRRLQKSSVRRSEEEYSSQVYSVLRATAGRRSDKRCQCLLSLPQPLAQYKASARATSNLNAKTIRPDSALFIPGHLIKPLYESKYAPFKVLCRNPRSNSTASHGGGSSFKFQGTLCARLPDVSRFEIASTFFEDKKPSHQELAVAYRQNRMSTAAALRQLHTLNVNAPVVGLVFAEGTVQAHVDWWEFDKELRIISAGYPGRSSEKRRRYSSSFHEWDLGRSAGIIQVYLLLRNLDRWTVGRFKTIVEDGIQKLAKEVREGDRTVVPWRFRGGKNDDTDTITAVVGESISSPVKPRRARTRFAKGKA